ncbi:MAG: serine/threonine protein phosphatase, partial [Lachnospiraceae bacterium]|nr:serine/threonine protein phosphatase [Lachnospiraceae bacterium]
MSYITRLDRAFDNAPILPIGPDTRYVFFSDCHRGIGNNNDNFLKNINCYSAALQYYLQYGFCYIEAGDGDELWENRRLSQITEIHDDVFLSLINI